MKYLNVILTTIVILLLSISFKLINISALLNISNHNNQAAINFNQELINSNRMLEKRFSNLLEEVEELSNHFLSKEKKGAEMRNRFVFFGVVLLLIINLAGCTTIKILARGNKPLMLNQPNQPSTM